MGGPSAFRKDHASLFNIILKPTVTHQLSETQNIKLDARERLASDLIGELAD